MWNHSVHPEKPVSPAFFPFSSLCIRLSMVLAFTHESTFSVKMSSSLKSGHPSISLSRLFKSTDIPILHMPLEGITYITALLSVKLHDGQPCPDRCLFGVL